MHSTPKFLNQTASAGSCLLATFLLTGSGLLQAAEPLDCLIEPHLLVDVSSSEIGVLATVEVDEADVIKKGDVIAALRTDVERAVLELSLARANAASEVELLRKDYEFNVRKSDRVDRLRNQKVVSAQNADEVRTAQDVARLRLKAAAEKQRTVRLEAERDALALARRIVHSPINGVVIKRHKSAGEYVEGDPIVQLAQLDPLRIEVVAPIALYGQLKKGMQAVVTPELAVGGSFVATVVSIDPVMDAATATFGVRLSLPNPQRRLPAGLKCTLLLMAEAAKPVPPDGPGAAPESSQQSSGKNMAAVTGEGGVPEQATVPAPEASRPRARDNAPAPQARHATPATQPAQDQALAPQPMPTPPVGAPFDQPPSVVLPQSDRPAVNTTTVMAATDRDTDFSTSAACTTLGPINNTARAKKLQSMLSARNMNATVRDVTKRAPQQMWIVVSSGPQGATGELSKRLKQAGITDFQLLRSGPWNGRISYGVYRGPKHAMARAKAMSDLGFKAERIQKHKTSQEFWLDLAQSSSNPALKSMLGALGADYPGLSLEPGTCPQVASR